MTPIGLAILSADCRYLQINRRLYRNMWDLRREHLGRSVRECVPALADAVEGIVCSITTTGEPMIGGRTSGSALPLRESRFHPGGGPAGDAFQRPWIGRRELTSALIFTDDACAATE